MSDAPGRLYRVDVERILDGETIVARTVFVPARYLPRFLAAVALESPPIERLSLAPADPSTIDHRVLHAYRHDT